MNQSPGLTSPADNQCPKPTPRLAIVVPCLDEEEVLPLTHRTLALLLAEMTAEGIAAPGSFILYVDDGSSDSTWQIISALSDNSEIPTRGIKLASNAGHQNALMAGLQSVAGSCDAAISIDADLQDDPQAIREMTRAYLSGYEIVCGVRRARHENRAKRLSARIFYRLRSRLGVKTIDDHADFRLLSAKALRLLNQYSETNLYLRGIIPLLGLRQSTVSYDRTPRLLGHSKYPLGKMLNFAADGITSFTPRPARLILLSGLIFMIIALAILIYVLIRYFSGHTIAGWTSIILSVWLCTGILLLALGILGEYIAKIYMEVKRRPRWLEESRCGFPR